MLSKTFTIRDSVHIHASVERCFLLSTSLAIVERELRMHPVAGTVFAADGVPVATRTEGLAQGGDCIRWEGWQLGLPQAHVSLICAFHPYSFFQDRMIEGRFRQFQHDHAFRDEAGGTALDDEIRFSLPWGFAGWLVGRFILGPHIRRLLRRRFRLLKRLAETEEWRAYMPEFGQDSDLSDAQRNVTVPS